jgi:hypothetical protein
MNYGLWILMTLVIFGCAQLHWNYYYPYSNVNPEKFHENLPRDYEECLQQFDTILTKEAIQYFKNRDSTVAAIEISESIGGLFSNFWNLEYYRRQTSSYKPDGYPRRGLKIPGVLEKFMKDSLSDPEAMIRVLFTCYHKKLNHQNYNWENEIQQIKSYWIPAKDGEGWVSPKMKQRENEILADYHFKQLAINDTVDVLFNRSPRLLSKTSDWNYLTGIIQSKIPDDQSIHVKLISIQTEFGKDYIISEEDTLSIGDTLTSYSKGWLKRGFYYFNYHRNTEYRNKDQ